jgi:hypothetical protein
MHPDDVFTGEDVAVYIAWCDECEVHARVTDVTVTDGADGADGGLVPTSVTLTCGHDCPLE